MARRWHVLAGALLVLFVCGCGRNQVWFKGSLDAALQQARDEGKLVLIDFYSPT